MLRDFHYDVAIWLDASIRLDVPGDAFLEEAVKRGGIYLPLSTGIPSFVVTDPGLYKYLPPYSVDSLKKHIQKGGGFVVVLNTEDVYWKVLHWWYMCSLDFTCQAPPGHSINCGNWKDCVRDRTAICWKRCHRYDQSTINILYNNYLYGLNKTALIRSYDKGQFRVHKRPTSVYKLQRCN